MQCRMHPVYLLETVALAFAGAPAGAILGAAAQMALPHLAAGLVHVTVVPPQSWQSLKLEMPRAPRISHHGGSVRPLTMALFRPS